MKKSDRKQWEKAWDSFNSGIKDFLRALDMMSYLDEEDYTIDDLNQMGGRLKKLSATIERIAEDKHNVEA